LILIADLGATNARFCITEDGNSYSNQAIYPINSYEGLEKLCSAYLASQDLVGIQKAVIGVAAPITGDIVNFINTNLKFSIQNLRNELFSDGLIVVNDLALQANALFGIDEKNLSYIGEKKINELPKILVSPGTGLGLAGIVRDTVIATEAGHINISDTIVNQDLKSIIDRFSKENSRAPTYEDFLSGKGIIYFYESLFGSSTIELSSEAILLGRKDDNCLEVINLLNYLLASYLRYVTLVWGSTGGVFLSGSIVKSLVLQEDYSDFRSTFEDSDTMSIVLQSTPLAIVTLEDIGFVGGMEIAKKLIN